MMKAEGDDTEIMNDDMRSRRGAHSESCVNHFSNELCAEFVTAFSRQRRKGHGTSAVCQAIVASAEMKRQSEILFSGDTVLDFGITFTSRDDEFARRCEDDFGSLVGAFFGCCLSLR